MEMKITKDDTFRRIWSLEHGWGDVVIYKRNKYHKVEVKFDNGGYEHYTKNGVKIDDLKPTLFWEEVEISTNDFKSLRQRKMGEEYFFLAIDGRDHRFVIKKAIESNSEKDYCLFEEHNYFKTREAAATKLMQIKKDIIGDNY